MHCQEQADPEKTELAGFVQAAHSESEDAPQSTICVPVTHDLSVHLVQDELPAVENVIPSTQSVHAVSPAKEYLPAKHGTQVPGDVKEHPLL
jgi:hypothetical protein